MCTPNAERQTDACMEMGDVRAKNITQKPATANCATTSQPALFLLLQLRDCQGRGTDIGHLNCPRSSRLHDRLDGVTRSNRQKKMSRCPETDAHHPL